MDALLYVNIVAKIILFFSAFFSNSLGNNYEYTTMFYEDETGRYLITIFTNNFLSYCYIK